MKFDFWYGDTVKDVVLVDCHFSDQDCVYRGNMWNKDNKVIGDYETADSLEIEKTFNVKFE